MEEGNIDQYGYWDVDEQLKIANNFIYHSPIKDQPQRYTQLRIQAKEMAERILSLCPPSRERSLALTKLEESIFWANASIARNEKETNQENN